MQTPLYKKFKTNGTTLYTFPSVAEDLNFSKQNENYKMYISHFVLVNFPKQETGKTFDIENVFDQNNTSIVPNNFQDALVESLRNYVANHETTIRNSKIDSTNYYYNVYDNATTTEKIFFKQAKKLGLIDFETADINQEYFGSDTKYDDLGPSGNTSYFREYLFKERSNVIYDLVNYSISTPPNTYFPDVSSITPTIGFQYCIFELTASTKLEPGDFIIVNRPNLDVVNYSTTQSRLKIVSIGTTNTINDTIVVEIEENITNISDHTELEMYNEYEQFIQYIGEITGTNNVQLPDRAYTETIAHISSQHGKLPYSLFNVKTDSNYKPNAQYPILTSEQQGEIQGGENGNNPILTNPALYPGDIQAQFDNSLNYETQSGNNQTRSGNYYGVVTNSNINPTLLVPDFDGSLIDGITLNLDINDYAQAVSYTFPIETFNEFCATSFNNIAPKDFKFNGILQYYTIEDVSGNIISKTTNLYGVEFLDTPENDLLYNKLHIPTVSKYVSNGSQDGNAFTFSLDTNLLIESDNEPDPFDENKIYSLFGMELFYEALTRMTYFNDKITTLVNSNIELTKKVNDLSSLIFNQQDLQILLNRINNLEELINLYSTLQIGPSSTIIPELDTTVTPYLLRLKSVDKQYGYIYTYYTKNMYNEFENVNNLTDQNINEQTIPVSNGKDFLVVINNNDNSYPVLAYDNTIAHSKLKITLQKDLEYLQKCDILIVPNNNNMSSINVEPINDKKIELYINYNDTITTSPKLINTFSLPVTKYTTDGIVYNNEPLRNINTLQDVKKVFYSLPSNNERMLSFIVDNDLIGTSTNPRIKQYTRIFLKNLFLEKNITTPSNVYYDISDQYTVSVTPSYIGSEVIDLELISNGTGYSNGTNIITGIQYNPAYTNCTIDIEVVVSGGTVTSIKLLNANGNVSTPATSNSVTISGGTGAMFKVISKAVTKIDIIFDITTIPTELNTIFSLYDTYYALNSFNTKKDITKYLKILPEILFLNGYKIGITRINENNQIPITEFDKKYNIKIDIL